MGKTASPRREYGSWRAVGLKQYKITSHVHQQNAAQPPQRSQLWGARGGGNRVIVRWCFRDISGILTPFPVHWLKWVCRWVWAALMGDASIYIWKRKHSPAHPSKNLLTAPRKKRDPMPWDQPLFKPLKGKRCSFELPPYTHTHIVLCAVTLFSLVGVEEDMHIIFSRVSCIWHERLILWYIRIWCLENRKTNNTKKRLDTLALLPQHSGADLKDCCSPGEL